MQRVPPNRVTLLRAAVALAVLSIAARLWQIQVVRADDLKAQARHQHEQRIEIDGVRGGILDRNGSALAVSTDSFSLFAHPSRVTDPGGASTALAKVLGMPRSRILEKLRSDEPFVWIARRLDPRVATEVRALQLPIGAGQPFGFEMEGKRFYPQGSLGIHVLGFANIDQKGVEGIEARYDHALVGDSSTYLAVRDGRGGMFLRLVRPPARRAQDVVLTLDLVLQHLLERELDEAMRTTRAKAAAAILLDPSSGEILALANRPTVDPDQYGKVPADRRRNRAVVDLFEPGSTFKVVVGAAAIDRGIVSPTDVFHCEAGTMEFAGRRIRDHHAYGMLSFREIMENSSNIGMVKVGRRMSAPVLDDYIRSFGFGRKTGVELPAEPAGLLAAGSRWTPSTQASICFGHEIGVTALQMISAVGAIANDGVLVPPRIVLGTRDAAGVFHPAATGEPRRVVTSETSRTLADLLEGAVTEGTGKEAAVAGYRIAGKTGTAQKVSGGSGYSATEFVASFAGFAPARSPRLAAIVVLDTPLGSIHTGGLTAAPVFSRIVADALAYLRVPPDEDPLIAMQEERERREAERAEKERKRAGRNGAARSAEEDSGREPAPEAPIATTEGQVPDLRGMTLRGAVSTLVSRRYRARAEGRGVVVAQTPIPGTPLPEGEICSLILASDTKGRP